MNMSRRWRTAARRTARYGGNALAAARSTFADVLLAVMRKEERRAKLRRDRAKDRLKKARRAIAALPCRRCDAALGEPCRGVHGVMTGYVHHARWVPLLIARLARKAARQ